MSQTLHIVNAGPQVPESKAPQEPVTAAKKKHKKEDRLRAAWIAFVGRILAQFIGAAASVVLGLLVVRTYTARVDQAGVDRAAVRTTASRQATRATAQDRPGRPTVAVLPLQDFSAGASSGTFAESLTETLIADLAKVDGLHVVSRTSSMRYGTSDKALPEIADELGADLVIEGSIVRADGHVRVTAQLIDARTDQHLWAQSYDRPLGDLLGLEADVATAIARDVRTAIAPVLAIAVNPRSAASQDLKYGASRSAPVPATVSAPF